MSRVLQNTSFLLSAQVITKVISFFYTLFLAKSLGVETFGLYTVALSYFSLISAVSEFGINRYLTREVALNRHLSSLLCGVLLFRLTFVSVVFAIFAVALSLLDSNASRVSLSVLAVSAVLPQAIAFTLDSIYVGLQKIKVSSIGLLSLNISTTIIGIWLISAGNNVLGAVATLILGQIIYVLTLLLFNLKNGWGQLKNSIHRERALTKAHMLKITKGSLPYGILGILGLVYFKIDSLMLGYMKGSFEVGLYGAAYRFLEAIVFVPSSVATVLFPVLAKLHQSDPPAGGEVGRLYRKSLKALFGVSILILIGYIFILPILILSFLPQFAASIPALRLLSLTIPFMFVHVPGAMVLLSTDKYLKPVIFLSVFTVLFNVIGNLIFIPQFGLMGASYMTVVSEILSFLVFFTFLQFKVLR
ncbi:MAG: Membrane protein involved in the export of O-antigen and teichoic acid [Candidatus Daviesbacteria bacterium GW2011_GWA2_38_24]|uniref:Membrane protein involved in the export of O-antigen and teichoic acid n=1 Tax=Candidatus Daviesbacteria bacterium GW2011_GWA2_38_24 TaxID=1618422 RepID=A0A0G0JVN8_9BACT|nr:MAG: Membrane protein involved in the export of O-antigen and teichoic acid [Candidatus Daviesbacteria bacterium GW2011_GWA2_38_24]KKQ79189.1 MAG: Membrane protein involved in the export of O-antigen and teichoic acid [Candidatus Daviesbacteria bacterium GW2011_GWA1_38_7]OGE23121.1 MAG: hypothetical protein A2688_03685 [Candidatus Daviesbacteria bacterium RIFCSPHIGHO2_01_FULL_38_8]